MENLRYFAENTELFVVAHRGSSGTAPENTLSAISSAIEAGAKMIETDLAFTADNHIIAVHDPKSDNNLETSRNFNEMTLEEIKKIDIGANYAPEFAGEKIATLDEILSLAKDKVYLIVEIKSYLDGFTISSAEQIYQKVKEYDYLGNTLFASFDHNLIKQLKDNHPEIYTAAIKLPGDDRMPSELKDSLNISTYICSLEELNHELVANAKKSAVYIGAYSSDNEKELDYVLQFNIKAIVSNYPAKIINLLKAKNKI